MLAMAVQIPMARAFSFASGKAALTRASEVTLTAAAPRPCAPRAVVSTAIEGANPQAIDPSVNNETPIKYQRRRPSRSASVAADMMKTAIPEAVGRHHPLQAVLPHRETALDVGQRHVHDQCVEKDHEQAQASGDEREELRAVHAGPDLHGFRWRSVTRH